MFVVTQFPISDARAFTPQTGRLPAPHWRDPLPREFVRGFGPVQQRRQGGHAAFADEAYYASARQAIRIPNLEHAHLVPGRLGADCAFRRLHYDGVALARVEIGLRVPAKPDGADGMPVGLRAVAIDALISSVLDLPVRVQGLGAAATSLALHVAGPTLARVFAQATSKAGQGAAPALVRAVAPALLVQYQAAEIESLPADARTIDSKLTNDVPLAFIRREHGDQPIGIWLMREGAAPSAAERNLRIALLRVHAEQQALRHVLALLLDGTITYTRGAPESERIETYLNRAASLLPESYPGATPDKAIADVLHAYDEPVPADQRALISEALGNAKGQITRKLAQYLETGEQACVNSAPKARPIHVFVSYSRRDEAYVKEESDKSILAYLAGLEREGFVFWHDQELYASEIWDDRIKQEMARADIALVLVSQYFLNSRYITESELPALLAGRRSAGLSIVPLMVSASDWESQPWLTGTQFLPRTGTLLKEYRNRAKRDVLYLEILRTLRTIGAAKRVAMLNA